MTNERLQQIWGADASDPTQALAWIESCVANQVPEDLYVEFKRKTNEQTPTPDDHDVANLGRAVSGFANTDGGLIIWGVEAKSPRKDEPDVASGLRPIKGLKIFLHFPRLS
jgi:predicted HTH transcriptional regulator